VGFSAVKQVPMVGWSGFQPRLPFRRLCPGSSRLDFAVCAFGKLRERFLLL